MSNHVDSFTVVPVCEGSTINGDIHFAPHFISGHTGMFIHSVTVYLLVNEQDHAVPALCNIVPTF